MSTSSTPTIGNDLIIGTAAPDSINGLQGNDIISGQEGDDSLIGAEGADSLYGGSGNDQLFGGGSSDTAIVASSPIPFPGDLADSIEGGSGDDILRGNAGNDTLRGGDGDDNLRGDYGDDLIDGGDGIDFVSYYYQPLGLTSGLRFDASNIGTGSSGSVTFSDLIGGTDTLISIERVIFTGTDFADTVTGAQNADQLSGEGGDDSINGGPGNDLLVGGFGNDTLSGSYGDDRIDGGEGMDTATYMSRRENYTLSRASDGNWTVSFSGPIIAIFPAPPTEGADTLINVEKVQFADTVVNLADIPSVVPTVQFTTTASSANEGNSGSTTFTVQAALSAPSTQAVTVPISYSGTATSGTDYTNATLNITIPAGQTTGAVTFSVVGDTNVEPNETVILTMGTPSNATLSTNKAFTHTIGNDDFVANVIRGTVGNDKLSGTIGTDQIFGGLGNDTIDADRGNDSIYGEEGDDVVGANAYLSQFGTTFYLNGGPGNDTLWAPQIGTNNVTLVGGVGNDLYVFDKDGIPTIIENIDEGIDRIWAWADVDLTKFPNVEEAFVPQNTSYRIVGNQLNNWLNAAVGELPVGANVINGGTGNDTLEGGGGNDSLYGDDGDDSLLGGVGDDRLYGGKGVDTVSFSGVFSSYRITTLYDGTAVSGYQVAGPEGTDIVSTDIEFLKFDSGRYELLAGNVIPLNVSPTISVQSSKASINVGETATIAFLLSATSTDFASADITVEGGTLSNFTGSGASYSAIFSPTDNTAASGVVAVASDRFSNAAGIFNNDGAEANNSVTILVDRSFPAPSRNGNNGHWYQLVQSNVDWFAALAGAAAQSYRGLSGYLVVIDNAQENSFIKALPGLAGSNFTYWLGISDVDQEGKWLIKAGPDLGKQATFFDWIAGQPDNWLYGENFAHINIPWVNSSQWNNQAVNGFFDATAMEGYIIEYGGLPAAYTITPSATSVNEGSSVTFIIDTKNVEWGTNIAYTLTGISQSDLSSGSLTGTAVVNQQGVDGRATVTVALAADNLLEGPESLRITVGPTTSLPVTVLDNLPNKPWTRLLGSDGRDEAWALSLGPNGEVFIGGLVQGSVDGQSYGGGYVDAFVAKFTVWGTWSWTRLLGTNQHDHTLALSAREDGGVYAAGYTQGRLDGLPYAGGDDGFVTLYDASGTKVWTRLLGTSANEWVNSVALSTDGSFYLAGYSGGNLDSQSSAGGLDAFVSKFREDGTKIWTHLLGSQADDSASSVITTKDGAVYVGGWVGRSVDAQGFAGGPRDAFLSKFAENGTKIWTKLLGSNGDDFALKVATDTNGNVYLAGQVSGTIDGQNFSGGTDAFLAKYDSQGTRIWTRLLGSNAEEFATGLSVSGDGSVYISGYSTGSLGGSQNDTREGFVAKFSAQGERLWTNLLSIGPTEGWLLPIEIEERGLVLLAGNTYANLDGQSNRGSNDAFVKTLVVSDYVVPTVIFTSVSSSATEGNRGTSTITVQAALSATATQTVTVPISFTGTASSGSDYTNATSNITIPAGQTTGAATFSVVGDTNVEPNETVILTMGTPTNASLGINTTYTHTIVDDDPTTTQAPTGAFLRQAGHVVLDSQFVNVYGASALEVVVLGTDAANVAIDQNVERIHLPLDFQLYGYVQTGNLLNVYPARGGSVVMSVVVQNDSDGTVLVFPNGAISTKLTPISPTSPVPGIALGGLSISTSVDRPTVVDPLPAFVINLLPPPIPTPPQRPSDTSVFMGRDALFKAAVNGLRVYGSLGSETLAMANGVSAVVADQNIEAVRFEQRLSSYSFQQTGNVLNIHERASGVKLLEIPLQADADGTQLSFAGRSFAAKISTGVMRLGDKAVAQERPTPIESSVVVSVDRGGSFNADTDDVRFEFVAGTYNYSIAGFSAADQLVFPQGAVPSVSNTSYTDGRVNLGWALGGQTIAVTVTGLTTGQDAALNSTGDFNTVFGAGTVS